MIECPIKSMVLSGGDFTTQAVTGSVWSHRGRDVTCLAEDCQTCVGYRTLFVMDNYVVQLSAVLLRHVTSP